MSKIKDELKQLISQAIQVDLDLVELKQLVKTPIILDTRNVLDIKDLTSLGFKFDNVGRKAVK